MESNAAGTRHQLERNCPICAAAQGDLLGQFQIEMFEDAPVSGAFSLVACRECGFTFHDSPTTQGGFDSYYHHNACNFSSGGETVSIQFPNDGIRYERIYQAVRPHLSPDSVIFDVGCAKGGQLCYLQQRGYTRLYGVDPAALCVDYMKNNLGLPAEEGTATDLPFQGIKADLIIYSHIIEHVIDLQTLVSEAYQKLNPGGVVFVEVPDASRYGDFQNPPYCHIMFEHINHFEAPSLERLFAPHGFQLLESGLDMSTFVAPWPVVWAILRKEGAPAAPASPAKLGTGERLKGYLDWSAGHALNATLEQLASRGTPVYLWGIWQYAKQLMGMTALRSCKIAGLVDRDLYKQGKRILGHAIAGPELLLSAPADAAVIVAATNHQQQIVQELAQMAFRGTVVTLDGKACRL